jgi:FdrA protein
VTRRVEVRKGAYADSVTLMQVSQQLNARGDVTSALVAMATELNLEMLVDMGFEPPAEAAANDLVVAVELAEPSAEEAVLGSLEELLARQPSRSSTATSSGGPPPRTVGAAARRELATLALVSTPGRVAVLDAADALASGLDVMVFSDNVPVADEVALKELAARLGRLVMGPDCGTAVVNGVGLGFANVVRPGPVGMVAASGTGAQQLLALLDGCGVGVSSCLGVGGRDLSAAVGGRSTLAALDRLGADDTVTAIVLVSKPPAEEVADVVTKHAQSLGKPVVLGYLGPGRPDLTATAAAVTRTVGVKWREPRRWGKVSHAAVRGRYLRGLFSGGTLCDEAMLLATATLGQLSSNIPLAGGQPLERDLRSDGHTFIDFGDDALTAGRPHPMIDSSLRVERLAAELRDPGCGVVLLDVVLGYAASPDPAADLVPVISRAEKPVVVSLVGTRDDPQGLESTAERLMAAGAVVHASNAAAAREAIALVDGAS